MWCTTQPHNSFTNSTASMREPDRYLRKWSRCQRTASVVLDLWRAGSPRWEWNRTWNDQSCCSWAELSRKLTDSGSQTSQMSVVLLCKNERVSKRGFEFKGFLRSHNQIFYPLLVTMVLALPADKWILDQFNAGSLRSGQATMGKYARHCTEPKGILFQVSRYVRRIVRTWQNSGVILEVT